MWALSKPIRDAMRCIQRTTLRDLGVWGTAIDMPHETEEWAYGSTPLTRSSAKQKDQRCTYAFRCSTIIFHIRHPLPNSNIEHAYCYFHLNSSATWRTKGRFAVNTQNEASTLPFNSL